VAFTADGQEISPTEPASQTAMVIRGQPKTPTSPQPTSPSPEPKAEDDEERPVRQGSGTRSGHNIPAIAAAGPGRREVATLRAARAVNQWTSAFNRPTVAETGRLGGKGRRPVVPARGSRNVRK
jgi:hypothetical protein